MRIRVWVAAPVERLRYARRTSRQPIRTGAEPKVASPRRLAEQIIVRIFHGGGGVVHRLSGGADLMAPAQPVNNAGEAIQTAVPAALPTASRPGRTQAKEPLAG